MLAVTVAREAAYEFAAWAIAIGIQEGGNNGEGRQPGEGLNVVGGLHGIVHVLAQERQTDASDQADQKGQCHVAGLGGTRGIGRDHGGIDDANIGRLQSGGNPGFFELGEQAVVEGFVGFGVALEDIVLNHALGHQIGFDFLLIEGAREQLFALLGFVVVTLETRDHAFFLALDILVQVLQLRLEPEDLWKVGAVLIESVGV